jgi:hypothetical protein
VPGIGSKPKAALHERPFLFHDAQASCSAFSLIDPAQIICTTWKLSSRAKSRDLQLFFAALVEIPKGRINNLQNS